MREVRAAVIDYSYDGAIGNIKRGRLTNTGTPICVDAGFSEDSDREFIMILSHKNYAACHFADVFSECIVHQHFESTLLEYIALDKDAGVTPVMSYTIPNVAAKEPETCYYVLPKYRNIIRGLVEFVVHVHESGKSFKSLNLDNLGISNSELKVWGVKFKNMDAQSKAQDFLFVHGIIVDILGIEEGSDMLLQLYDFADLLSILFLFEGSEPENHLCLARHWSLLSTEERLQFIKNTTYKSCFLTPKNYDVFEKAVNSMGDNRGWNDRFTDPDPKLGPVYDCYHHANATTYSATNWSILRFCRNMATHLWTQLGEYKDNEHLSDLDVELVIINEFGYQLMMVYSYLVSKNVEMYFR